MKWPVDELAFDELAVNEMAVDDLIPHQVVMLHWAVSAWYACSHI